MIYLSCSETNWTRNLFPEAGFGDIFNLNGAAIVSYELWNDHYVYCLRGAKLLIGTWSLPYQVNSHMLHVCILNSYI